MRADSGESDSLDSTALAAYLEFELTYLRETYQRDLHRASQVPDNRNEEIVEC